MLVLTILAFVLMVTETFCLEGEIYSSNDYYGDPSESVECSTHEQCDEDKACHWGRCEDPCKGFCGPNTICDVVQHEPTCSCQVGFDACTTTCNPTEGCRRKVIYSSFRRNKEYKLFRMRLNFFEAMAHCSQSRMRLATFNNELEYNTLVRYLNRFIDYAKLNVWIAATDLGYKNQYKWISTGKDVVFTKWAPGEPNHFVYKDEEERCVELSAYNDYKMNDVRCSLREQFVCEF